MASIPRANAPISNNDGSPTREWYNYLRANLSPSDLTTVEGEITVIAEKLGSPNGTVQNIPPISVGGTIVAQQSVAAVGAFPGAVILNLVNDQASPGNTYFYGTSPTGSKGWVSLTTALGQASIGNLGDVDTTTTAPTDGQVLTWVSADSKWEPRTPTGGSLPPGGSTGQVLTKLSATDGDADWEDPTGGVQTVVGGSHINVDSTDPANPVVAVSGLSAGAGYAEGTAFPASPGLHDKFYRNDLNLLCYYDGTRWLTVNEYQVQGIQTDQTAGMSAVARWATRSDFQMLLTRWVIVTYSNASPSGSSYCTVALHTRTATNASTTLTSFVTSSDANANWVNHDQTVNAVIGSTIKEIQQVITQTGAGGGLFYVVPALAYRLIVT